MPGEAVAKRRERERAEWGLCDAETRVICRFALRRYPCDPVKFDPEDMLEWVMEIGYDTFLEVRERVRQYRREVEAGADVEVAYAKYCEGLHARGLPPMFEPPDVQWMHYH